ncbi:MULTISPECIES: restriction endonuclease-related protein [Streptomyces]|uniref:restriction endonuclease-related protein n=1 Tax=Streptomyces TaxID=1883 RepID=UPI003322FC7D
MGLVERNTPRWRRDLALTACCAAAVAEADRISDPGQRAARLIDCLGVLRSTHGAGTAASLDMGALRHGLRHGLAPLLPAGGEGDDPLGGMRLLDEGGLLCDAVEDLGREHLVPQQALMEYWPWARLRAEQEEQQLYAEIRRLPSDDYARVRELLASDPVAEQGVLWEKWGGLWGRFGFFEPVSSWPWCNAAGWCFPCPACAWPMRAQSAGGGVFVVSCDAHLLEGAQYTYRPVRGGGPPVLEGGGGLAGQVEGFPAAGDCLAVSRTVWRYLTLPGRMEFAIRDALAGIAGLDILMYPDGDRYDLHITAAAPLVAKQWRVDAKAWRSFAALADALLERPVQGGAVPLTIVVPHRQRSDLPLLRARLAGRPDFEVMTDEDLIGEVRRWCRGEA